jgi:hypothetical protein
MPLNWACQLVPKSGEAVPEESLRLWTQRTLGAGRAQSAMGQAVQSGDAFYPDLSTPEASTEFINFLINEVNSLSAIVVRLATEIDALRGT